MGEIIRFFSDGSFLEYDQGSFDKWCVYLTQRDGSREPPRDTDYFAQLKQLSARYGAARIYGDYVRVYIRTGKQVEESVFRVISTIAASYGSDALKVDVIFSILYMAMIAEEQKENTRLGKRIKRLGIYALLMENRSVSDAANFMRGMDWKDIAKLCRERGF